MPGHSVKYQDKICRIQQLSLPGIFTLHTSHDHKYVNHTTRYDFQLSQAITASLPQFCLQFAAYMVILYMLETLKGLSVDKATQDTVQEKIDSFAFSSLWFSGLGSALSLIVAQYTAFKIQHEHDLTWEQR